MATTNTTNKDAEPHGNRRRMAQQHRQEAADWQHNPKILQQQVAVVPSSLSSLPQLAVYYYPWYGCDFHHHGPYLRKLLDPPQEPVLGEYDDTTQAVITQHVQWCVASYIHIWITSWWGPTDRTDTTILQTILTNPEFQKHQNMKLAMLYETKGRMKPKKQRRKKEQRQTRNIASAATANVGSDIEYIAKHYFSNPQYLRVKQMPVIFVYLTRSLYKSGILQQVVDTMRSAAAKQGYPQIYIVGDQVWGDAPDSRRSSRRSRHDNNNNDNNNSDYVYEPFQYLDAVTNYDVYGNLRTAPGGSDDCYARQTRIDHYQARQVAWKEACQRYSNSTGSTTSPPCAFIPSVTPGFNKHGTRIPLSRRMDETSESGSLFRALLRNALHVTDLHADHLVCITSWNEWHEDTQIEPVTNRSASNDDDDDDDDPSHATNRPVEVTNGVEYEPYRMLYLEILQQEMDRLQGSDT